MEEGERERREVGRFVRADEQATDVLSISGDVSILVFRIRP
jgi:hypothetical protein